MKSLDKVQQLYEKQDRINERIESIEFRKDGYRLHLTENEKSRHKKLKTELLRLGQEIIKLLEVRNA